MKIRNLALFIPLALAFLLFAWTDAAAQEQQGPDQKKGKKVTQQEKVEKEANRELREPRTDKPECKDGKKPGKKKKAGKHQKMKGKKKGEGKGKCKGKMKGKKKGNGAKKKRKAQNRQTDEECESAGQRNRGDR